MASEVGLLIQYRNTCTKYARKVVSSESSGDGREREGHVVVVIRERENLLRIEFIRKHLHLIG